ncbi:signal peptidase I [Sphingomonas sp. ASV193]|uniref:signal peptidase I n=1 Tax=Sphingomonas sp. ASV193 TaxID=3144405 RepID=UPI0032E859B1
MNDATTPAPATTAEPPAKKKDGWRGWLQVALFAWILRCLVVAPFSIPSGSMLPNMWIGDYLFVTKWNYGYSKYSFLFDFPPISGRLFARTPTRGDIIVFRGPNGADWVKRAIGLPGDRIAVVNGAVFLNGQPLKREALAPVALPVSPNSPCVPGELSVPTLNPDGTAACKVPAYRETLPNGVSYLTLNSSDVSPTDNFAEVTVPAGHLFMMGDDRDDSADSRVPVAEGGLGFVPEDNLIGKATIRFWSTDGSSSWFNPISWFSALRANRIGGSYNS